MVRSKTRYMFEIVYVGVFICEVSAENLPYFEADLQRTQYATIP